MRQLLLAVGVIAVLLFSGCAKKVDVINKEVYNDAKKFDGVTVRCLDDNESKQLQNYLVRAFKAKHIALDGGLVVRCGYGYYDKGNRFLRSTIGFGAGHGRAAANFILQSKTGEKIAKFDVNVILNRGEFLGGSAKWMHKAVAKQAYIEVRKYIEKNSLIRKEMKNQSESAEARSQATESKQSSAHVTKKSQKPRRKKAVRK